MAVINNIPNTTDNSQFYPDTDGYGYSEWVLKIVANSGYRFDTPITVTYTNNSNEEKILTLTPSGQKLMVTQSVTDGNESTTFITKGEVVDTSVLTVQNNIMNTTATGKYADGTATVTVTCEKGYIFTSPPKVQYSDSWGSSEQPMLLNVEKTIATFTTTDIEVAGEISVTGETTTSGTPTATVINNIADTTAEVTYDGVTANVVCTSVNEPLKRFLNPEATYQTTNGETKTVQMDVEIQQNNSVATAVITDLDPSIPITLRGEFTLVISIVTNLSNCTSNEVIPTIIKTGSTLNNTLIANENCLFETAPKIDYQDGQGYPNSFYYTIAEDKKTATISLVCPSYLTQFSIVAEAIPQAVVGENYGSINVYVVTKDTLNEFAQKRFFKESESGADVSYEMIDLGIYVNRVNRFFCPIPTSSTDVLRCGNYNTNINVFQPSVERITLDFGNVVIPKYNNDVTDLQSDIKMFIPFKGFVDIPSNYVGETINLQIDVNIITGNGLARVMCDGVNIMYVQIIPSADVIFRTADPKRLTTIGNDSWNEAQFYGFEPFLYIQWFNSVNSTGRNSDSRRDIIGTFQGFTAFQDIEVIATSSMLADEQTAIYDALKRGVYLE